MEVSGLVVGEAWSVEYYPFAEVLPADVSSVGQCFFEFSALCVQQAFVVIFPARQRLLLQLLLKRQMRDG